MTGTIGINAHKLGRMHSPIAADCDEVDTGRGCDGLRRTAEHCGMGR